MAFIDLKSVELLAFNELMIKTKEKLQKDDNTILGFNIGINQGEIAGQTIFHTHIHLIPRRKGDVENPRGGVRNVILGKGDY
jgi:diadenosine tetraphosphate (Ap4A) HIT family hydrolase